MKKKNSAKAETLGDFLKRLFFVLLWVTGSTLATVLVFLLVKKGLVFLPEVSLQDFSGVWSVLGMVGQGVALIIGAFVLFGIRPIPTNYVGVTTLFGKIQNRVLHEGINLVWFWYDYQKASTAPRTVKLEPTEFEFRDAPSKIAGVHIQVQVNPTCPQGYFRLTEETRETEVDGAVRSVVQKVLQNLIDNAGSQMTVDEFKGVSDKVTKELSRTLNSQISQYGVLARVISLGDITLPDRIKQAIESVKTRERMAVTLKAQEGHIRKLVEEGLDARRIQPPVEETPDQLQKRIIPLVLENLKEAGYFPPLQETLEQFEARLKSLASQRLRNRGISEPTRESAEDHKKRLETDVLATLQLQGVVRPVAEDLATREARLAGIVRASFLISSTEPVPPAVASIFSKEMQTLRQLEEQKFLGYAAAFSKELERLEAIDAAVADRFYSVFEEEVARLRSAQEKQIKDFNAAFSKELGDLKAEERRRYDDAKRTYDEQVERLEASFQHEQEEATKQELYSKNPNFLLGLDPTGKKKGK